jgi:2-oxoglutarate/2-oxoacid ferredoxin oxidoreductase subunit beta
MKTLLDDIIHSPQQEKVQYKPKDFKPEVDVRWCAGCGGFAILSQSQKLMPDLDIPREKIVYVSGIGCSGRFPYYMETYGFHGIHGRPLVTATGLKIARPDLSVWVATGDGDCMSIGGNHLIHACRRNIDINVVMFNNEVYSLTKGQFSPTSRVGQITKSSPLGVLDDPFNPATLVLGSGASFYARGYDRDTKQMKYLFERAAKHKGISFVEIYTNCLIFNEGAFDNFTEKEVRKEKTVVLEHGMPLVFGENEDKGIRMDGFTPVVVFLTDGKYSKDDLLVHNEKDSTLAFILANMTSDETLPRPVGVFQAIERPSYDEKVEWQIQDEINRKGEGDLELLLKGRSSWEVK